MKLDLVLVFLFISTRVRGLKILGLFPHPGRSHYDVFEPLFNELATRGHNLTIVSHFAPRVKFKNWENIPMGEYAKYTRELNDIKEFETKEYGLQFIYWVFDFMPMADSALRMCEVMTKLDRVRSIVYQREHFDIALVELFNSDCALGIVNELGLEAVALQSHPLTPWSYERFSQPKFNSYFPCIVLKHAPHMSFLERAYNVFADFILTRMFQQIIQIKENVILNENLKLNVSNLNDLSTKTVALLSNTHFTFHGVKPLVPSIVEVGGIHLKKDFQKIDEELDKYMNSSEHGVIIFSMGSMLKSSTFPVDKREAFVNAFSKVKENVIWKWEGDPIPGLSSNVKVIRWLPQMELLHHPKTVAFISHGGLLGTTEALHAGVPTLYIPVFADQGTNSAAAVEKGIGARVLYTDVSEERISTELAKVLSPEMRLEAKKLSEQWRDRESPLKTAADTVEYVAKYGGKHLRSPAQDLYWFQIYSLDVYLFIFVIILSILVVDYLAIRWLLRVIFNKKDVPITKPPFKRKPEQFNNNNNNNEKYKIN